MRLHRREFLGGLGSLATLTVASVAGARPVVADDDILVGSLHDLSGGLDIYGKPMEDAVQLAAEEINAAGGLLGRRVAVVTVDPQSRMDLYGPYAERLARSDKVAVVHGGISSAAREVIRPVLRNAGTLYFYNTQYEGGVCDRNIFCTGQTPGQNLEKLVPHVMNKWGRKIYIVAADYNYGQITAKWVRKYCTEGGGEIAATDFFPLDATEFDATIGKIRATRPDVVISVLVGSAHISFYRQWAAAGMNGKIGMASTTFGTGNEHVVLPSEATDGMIAAFSYFETIDSPANKQFVDRWHRRFGEDYPYIGELAVATYQGMHLWAHGVAKAGTTDRMAVVEALETGLSFDGPSGTVAVDPATHHCVLDVRLAQIRDGRWDILETFEHQPPIDTAGVCDLGKNPDETRQFVIDM